MNQPTLKLTSPWHRVATNLYVTFAFDGEFHAEWEPRPPRAPIPRKTLRRYDQARNEFIRRIAEAVGGRVLVVDEESATGMGSGAL